MIVNFKIFFVLQYLENNVVCFNLAEWMFIAVKKKIKFFM